MPLNGPGHYRHLWKEALDTDLDCAVLLAIRDDYRKALRLEAAWDQLYIEQREAYLADRVTVRQKVQNELRGQSKPALMNKLGVEVNDYNKRVWTIERLIDWIADNACNGIENEHSRVKRIWATMTDDERLELIEEYAP